MPVVAVVAVMQRGRRRRRREMGEWLELVDPHAVVVVDMQIRGPNFLLQRELVDRVRHA